MEFDDVAADTDEVEGSERVKAILKDLPDAAGVNCCDQEVEMEFGPVVRTQSRSLQDQAAHQF